MRNNRIYIFFLLLFFSTAILAQNATIEGYVFESNNRGYLNLVKITITDKASNYRVNTAATDVDGYFSVQVPIGKDYIITAEKDVFADVITEVSTKGVAPNAKVYTKIKMGREPGYLFDVTLAEKWDGQSQVDAIQGAWIEIYNNTKEEAVLELKKHPDPYFKFTFEKGNHYTVMVRKKGYFTKRMEAYVDVDGCILCFDGLDDVSPSAPGASDNLTAGNLMGTIVSNVEMVPIVIGESIKIKNIYYDLAKWDIRNDAAKELDKLIVTLKSNPSLLVELGSHTDARGSDGDNMSLSQKRAQAAVDYMVKIGEIDPTRIYGKGYGETELDNNCGNGVKCSESEHQENRRTELKIVGVRDEDPFDGKTLAQIIQAENFDSILAEIQNQEVVQVMEGQQLPDEIRKQVEGKSTDTDFSPPSNTSNSTYPENAATQTTTPAYTKPQTNSYPSQTNTPATTNNNNTTYPQNAYVPPPTKTPAYSESIVVESQAASSSSYQQSKEPAVISNYPTTTSSIEYEVSTQFISRPPKELPSEYSGFKIEFFTAISQLPMSHEIFSKHGNITVEQNKDGRYAYLLGNFQNKTSALNFLRDVMLRQYPTSRVIKYSKGRRTTK